VAKIGVWQRYADCYPSTIPIDREVAMMNRLAIALAAGALAAPAAALAQQRVPPPVVYSVPTPQSGLSYYCANPQGWHPTVQSCSVAWVAYVQPQPVVQVAPGPVASPQTGVNYWCGNPQGWYPSVQRCSVAWTPYAQTTYVVAAPAPQAYVLVQPQPAPAPDPASAVYYVGSHRNAPYQSGIFP
jgi:hypothetical protein